MRQNLILTWIFLLNIAANAQPVVQAVKVLKPPVINGVLNDSCWLSALHITEFLQREPENGIPATQHTDVFICFDLNNLYVAFRCIDTTGRIIAKEMARDISQRDDDRVMILLDTHLDGRNAYWFQINPRGCLGDALVTDNGAGFNKQWDGLWDGRAKINDQGWEAEMIIPFKTLGFEKGINGWGMKLIRHIKHNEESDYWPGTNLNTYEFQVSDEGLLTGLEGISRGAGIDIVPYGLGEARHTYGRQTTYKPATGGEIFYRVTPGIRTAVTVNTDFAETEADSRQINLTRFSLHYPEKRGFFLDGTNYFNFGISGLDDHPATNSLVPFFSRRIGLDSAGRIIPILWGAKLTGQAGPVNSGMLFIQDEKNGKIDNFAAGRVSLNFGQQSSAGFICTFGNAISATSNSLAGLDLKLSTPSFLGNKNLTFIFYGLKSFTAGLKGDDFAIGGEIAYPNDLFFVRLGNQQIAENFTAGLGFVPRKGVRHTYFQGYVQPRPKGIGIIQTFTGLEADFINSWTNNPESSQIGITPIRIRFLSGDEAGIEVFSNYENLNQPFNIFKEDTINIGSYRFSNFQLQFLSARKRRLWLESYFKAGEFYNGTITQLILDAGYKIAVPLYAGIESEINAVKLPVGNFIAKVYRINFNLLINPRATLYSFVQYDNATGRLGWQSRFRWILKPGKEIYLVWNSMYSKPMERWSMEEGIMRMKVNYVFRF